MHSPTLARFAATPCLVAPGSRDWFESCLSGIASHPEMARMDREHAQTDDGFWPAADDWRAAYRPYVVTAGILQVPVKGVLLHNFPFALGSFATGYVYIWRAVQRGMADPNVRGIALICDSPGGHVAGCFDLVDRIHAMRGSKPMRAYAAEAAYSAAYAIASAADSITVTRTGGVGSIGVVTAHLDVSGAMDQAGLKVTFIFAGSHKVDGNPFEALPDDVKARVQARIDETYAVFVTTVSRNRGLAEQAVRDTEALCFSATEAMSNGLADDVGALDDAVAAFAAEISTTEEDDEMSGEKDAASLTAAHETAVAAIREQHRAELATATAAARAEGAKAERERCKTILSSDEAKGREEQARFVALESDMPADQAIGFLKATPKAQPGNRFDDAMQRAGNPNIGPGDPPADSDEAKGLAFADAYFAAKRGRSQDRRA